MVSVPEKATSQKPSYGAGYLLSNPFASVNWYFTLSSSKSPEVVLYSQQIVGLTRLLGHPAGI